MMNESKIRSSSVPTTPTSLAYPSLISPLNQIYSVHPNSFPDLNINESPISISNGAEYSLSSSYSATSSPIDDSAQKWTYSKGNKQINSKVPLASSDFSNWNQKKTSGSISSQIVGMAGPPQSPEITTTTTPISQSSANLRYVNAYIPNLNRPPTSSPVFPSERKKSPTAVITAPEQPEDWQAPGSAPTSPGAIAAAAAAAKKLPDIEKELNAQNLYKTELCRPFEEAGICRYGSKCQFAHGLSELRPVLRHPKYKTEICKTFLITGTCPYSSRCRFIHRRAGDEIGQNSIFIPPPATPFRGSPQLTSLWREVVQKKSTEYMSSCVTDPADPHQQSNPPLPSSAPYTAPLGEDSTETVEALGTKEANVSPIEMKVTAVEEEKNTNSGSNGDVLGQRIPHRHRNFHKLLEVAPELKQSTWLITDSIQSLNVIDDEIIPNTKTNHTANNTPWSSGATTRPHTTATIGRTVTSQHRDISHTLETTKHTESKPLNHNGATMVNKESKSPEAEDLNTESRRRGSSGSRLPFFQRLAEDTDEVVDDQNLAGSMQDDSQYLVDSH